jgi:hypothetical protein
MALPSRQEINVYDSLDERCACEHFLGKTLEQAETLFRENSLYYQEDLMFMGIVAFRFYVQAATSYIRSDASHGDSAIISCLVSILEFRLEHEAAKITSVADQLASICSYIDKNYERFDLAPEIFGDLRPRFQQLQKTFLSMSNPDDTV